MFRVFIAEDHTLMREGLKLIIDGSKRLQTVGEADNGLELLKSLVHTDCDVLLMDLSMPGMGGLDLVHQIRKLKPLLPILIMSMHNSGDIVTAVLKAGANGFITKNTEAEHLPGILSKIANGGKYLDTSIASRTVFERVPGGLLHDQLSLRERQILLLIASGQSTNQIAAQLGISPKTVSTHKKHVMEKLEINNTADLVRYSIKHHLVDAALPDSKI